MQEMTSVVSATPADRARSISLPSTSAGGPSVVAEKYIRSNYTRRQLRGELFDIVNPPLNGIPREPRGGREVIPSPFFNEVFQRMYSDEGLAVKMVS